MMAILSWLKILVKAGFQNRRDLVLENLALRQQLAVLNRTRKRLLPQLCVDIEKDESNRLSAFVRCISCKNISRPILPVQAAVLNRLADVG
jgi:ABC-type uncharacterized transport system ATPase subunit